MYRPWPSSHTPVMLHVLDEQHNNSYNDPVLLEVSLFRKEIFNRATLETGLWLQQKGAEMQLICHPLIHTSSNSGPFLLWRAVRPSSAWGSLLRKHVTSTFDNMKLHFFLTPPPCISPFIHQSVLFHCHLHADCWELHSHTHLNGCMGRALNTQQWGGGGNLEASLIQSVRASGGKWFTLDVSCCLYIIILVSLISAHWVFPSEDAQTVRYNPLFIEKNPLRLWRFVLFVCVNKTVEY